MLSFKTISSVVVMRTTEQCYALILVEIGPVVPGVWDLRVNGSTSIVKFLVCWKKFANLTKIGVTEHVIL